MISATYTEIVTKIIITIINVSEKYGQAVTTDTWQNGITTHIYTEIIILLFICNVN